MRMRRLSCAVVVLMCLLTPLDCLAGFALRGYDREDGYQYVELGSFSQDADGTERPILWRVLSAERGEAYLLSEYILFNNRVHPDDDAYAASGGAWNQTELFGLLNGPFVGEPLPAAEREALLQKQRLGRVHIAETCFKDEAFTPLERSMLEEDEALGMIFLPASDDLNNPAYGFGTERARRACGTPYALANGLFLYGNGSSPYWTRTQSTSFRYGTRCTKVGGKIGYIRCVVMNEGCRPAVRLKLSGLEPVSGDGSYEFPYAFDR